MRITALVENTSENPDYETEHGLSLYIETDSHNILFDMGQSDMFIRNATKLGIDLSKVDIAVLSHGHYDHGGGLKAFLDINHNAPVYVSSSAFEPHYNGVNKYIGLDTTLYGHNRLIENFNQMTIAPGLTLYSCNDYEKAYDLGSFDLNMMVDGQCVPDDFKHEHYLLIEENNKKILISGCSHKGILNIANWFKPDILVGGFHFSKLPLDDTLKEYAKYLDSFHTEYYTCHCTGTEQFAYMSKYMNRLHYLSTGQRKVW